MTQNVFFCVFKAKNKPNCRLHKKKFDNTIKLQHIMNSNRTSQIPTNGLNWFQLQEIAWGCFHYIIFSYVMPVICVISIIENFAIIIVIPKMPSGIAKTARLYYLAIAYCDIGFMTYYLVLFFVSGLKFTTQATFYLSLVDYNLAACKALQGLTVFLCVLVMFVFTFDS